jgi:hypothetical protein
MAMHIQKTINPNTACTTTIIAESKYEMTSCSFLVTENIILMICPTQATNVKTNMIMSSTAAANRILRVVRE